MRITMRQLAACAEGTFQPGESYVVGEAITEERARAFAEAGAGVLLERAVAPPVETAVEPEWPLKSSPAAYLKRSPNGKHAALARELAGG